MRRLAFRSALVVLTMSWLVSQLLPSWQATPALADALNCASPGFVLQRAPLSAGFDADRSAPIQRFVSAPLHPQVFPPADISVTIVDSPDPINPLGTLTYTITVHNDGPGDGPGLLTTAVPDGTTFVSINNAGISGCWFCATTPAVGATGPITCDSTIFPVGESEEFVLVVQLTGSALALSPLELTAVVSGDVDDSMLANNTAKAFTMVSPPTPTITLTPTVTSTATQTLTPTVTSTATPTLTPTVTPTGTQSPTATPTITTTPASTQTLTPTTTPAATVTSTVPPTKSTTDDKPKPKTDTQRQQDDHSNQLGRDDYHTEGNVVEVFLGANPPYAMIATRDGLVQVLLVCDGGCPTVRPGDYVQVDGVKENEGLFTAEEVTVSR